MYNQKEANKSFIHTAAWLARDMGFDPDQLPTEDKVESWRDAVMGIIQQHKAAHERIAELEAEAKGGDIMAAKDAERIAELEADYRRQGNTVVEKSLRIAAAGTAYRCRGR